MNKEFFLKRLEELLFDIPEEERENALWYYRDYFEEAGEEKEKEVIRELGSPERIAFIIKTNLIREKEHRESGGEFTEHGYTMPEFDEKQNFVVISDDGKKEEKIKERIPSSYEKNPEGNIKKQTFFRGKNIAILMVGAFCILMAILATNPKQESVSLFDEIIKHSGDFSNSGKYSTYKVEFDHGYYIVIGDEILQYYSPKKEQMTKEQWNKVVKNGKMLQAEKGVIHIAVDDIEGFNFSTVGKNIEWETSDQNEIVMENVEDTTAVFIKDSELQIHDGKRNPKKNKTLTIKIPKKEWKSMMADTTSGSVTGNVLSANEVSINTTSGEVQLTKITANEVMMDTTSGNVIAQNIKCDNFMANTTSGVVTTKELEGEEITIDTTSGGITMEDVKNHSSTMLSSTSGNISMKKAELKYLTMDTTSGDIICDDVKVVEEIEMDTTSGSIDIQNLESKETVVSTTSGNIACEGLLKTDLYGETSSGDMQLQVSGEKKDYCYYVDNGMGTLTINGEKMKKQDGVYEKQFPKANYNISFESNSGNCEIGFKK